MKHNILDDPEHADYSDDENRLEINEQIDNITDCKQLKVKNDNSNLIVSYLANDEYESNLPNDKSNIEDHRNTKSYLEQPFTSTDTSPASPLIETFKKKQVIVNQIFSDMSEHITRNEYEYNANIQRLENENKILKQEIEDEKEKSRNFNKENSKLKEENQIMAKEIQKLCSTHDTLIDVNLELIYQKDSLLEENKNLKEKNLDLTRHCESQVSTLTSIVKTWENQLKIQIKDSFDSMMTTLNKKIVPNEPVPISTNESHQNKNKSYENRQQSNSYVSRGDSKRFNNNNDNNNQRHKLNNYNNYNYNNKSEKENSKSCGKNGNRWEPRLPSYSKSRSRSR